MPSHTLGEKEEGKAGMARSYPIGGSPVGKEQGFESQFHHVLAVRLWHTS